MKLVRGGTMGMAGVLLALLAGCTAATQNGATVSAPAASPGVVPAPLSIAVDATAAPFRIDRHVRILGNPDAAAALTAIVAARTGTAVPARESAPPAAESAPSAPESAPSAPESAPSAPESAPSAPESAQQTPESAPTIALRIEPGGAAESYRITADAASVVVTGADAAGLFYGVQTLGQLIIRNGSGFVVPAARIADAPRFAYRGVMLDVARHFFPVETVKAYIDRASGLKLNALHLHLSDDQGWRIQLDSRPRLTERAAATAVGGDAGGFYSKADYREIVAYAASRHMIVVPEVDVPGHTHAVGLAYPELAEEPDLPHLVSDGEGAPPVAGTPYTGTAVGFSSLKIHDEATYDFVADVMGELAAMTPGPYLHIGGDEALGTDPDDFALFMARATGIVADLGKIPVTWHEAGAAPDIDPSTIGQYWGFTTPTDGADEKARAFADSGGVILSPADAVYLDMKYDASSPFGLTWANGPTSVQRAYSWEPASIIDGVDEDDILGVEAPLWTETIRTLDDIDRMAFPRVAAAAEIAWSSADGELRTWESFRSRVGALGPLWTSLGIRFHASDEIPWATQ
ncbi:family 20 glycosylhydrolase [Microbacterium terregens]|uniref:beta-N-acetylhexosaminidase n=1 Tax=Microbacterium terregens TaxID=69363 RepID=A0ABV5SZB6_9MICO